MKKSFDTLQCKALLGFDFSKGNPIFKLGYRPALIVSCFRRLYYTCSAQVNMSENKTN